MKLYGRRRFQKKMHSRVTWSERDVPKLIAMVALFAICPFALLFVAYRLSRKSCQSRSQCVCS